MSRYLGELIEARKLDLGLSLQKIGDAIGLSKSYVGHIVQGKRQSPLDPDKRAALARILEVPLAEVEEAIRKDQGIGGYDVAVKRSGRKATVVARVDELDDDDVTLEIVERILEAEFRKTRRRNTR